MIDYFIQATRLLLGESFFVNFTWASGFLDILVVIYAAIILIVSFRLLYFLAVGWWSKWL